MVYSGYNAGSFLKAPSIVEAPPSIAWTTIVLASGEITKETVPPSRGIVMNSKESSIDQVSPEGASDSVAGPVTPVTDNDPVIITKEDANILLLPPFSDFRITIRNGPKFMCAFTL